MAITHSLYGNNSLTDSMIEQFFLKNTWRIISNQMFNIKNKPYDLNFKHKNKSYRPS